MILSQITAHQRVLAPAEESIRLSTLPPWHAFGLILDRLLGIMAGQTIYIAPDAPGHPRARAALIEHLKVEWLAGVPRTLNLLAVQAGRNEDTRRALQQLHVHSGGAPMPPDQRGAIESVFGAFRWGYGLTECGPGVLIDGRPVGCEIELHAFARNGEPTHNSSLCNEGQLYEVCVRTPSLGFFDNREELMIGEAYRTGDLGYAAPDGRIEVVGRAGDSLKSAAGTWIHITSIEDDLRRSLHLEAVHVSRRPEAGARQVRLLFPAAVSLPKNAYQLQKLATRLSRTIAETVEFVVCSASPAVVDELSCQPRKSLDDALGWLPIERFSKIAS